MKRHAEKGRDEDCLISSHSDLTNSVNNENVQKTFRKLQ